MSDDKEAGPLTDAEKWQRIAAAWETYCNEGANAFDWDYDSRDLMQNLTGDRPYQGMFGGRQ